MGSQIERTSPKLERGGFLTFPAQKKAFKRALEGGGRGAGGNRTSPRIGGGKGTTAATVGGRRRVRGHGGWSKVAFKIQKGDGGAYPHKRLGGENRPQRASARENPKGGEISGGQGRRGLPERK